MAHLFFGPRDFSSPIGKEERKCHPHHQGPHGHGPHSPHHGPHGHGPHSPHSPHHGTHGHGPHSPHHGPHGHGPHSPHHGPHSPHGHGPHHGQHHGYGPASKFFWEFLKEARNGNQENSKGDFTPDFDVYENDEFIYAELEIAGLDKENINIDWNTAESKLVITGKKVKKELEGQVKSICSERKFGEFKREIVLNPNYIDINSIEASFKDGLLLIKIAKKDEESLKVKINIQ